MGNAVALLNLLTQIKPIIDFFLANQDSIGSLLAVIKKLADLFGKPATTAKFIQGLSRSQLEEMLQRFAIFLQLGAELTPTKIDDAVAGVVGNAVSTPWLLDFFYQLATGQAVINQTMVELAMAQVQAESLEVTPTV